MNQHLPEELLERFKEIFPPPIYESVLATLSTKRPISLRINSLISTKDEVLQEIENAGVSVSPVSWYSNAFVTSEVAATRLTELPLYRKGGFYIQNLSSMIPALVMDIKEGEKVLDLCAAPGSKTSQIAALLHNSGEIVACDKSRDRLYKLQANLKQQGVTNTKVVLKPGEILWKWYPEYFDATLVDVPCSMEGRISVHDKDSYKDWSKKKIKVLSKIQKNLLRSGVSAAKVGGLIIYSTCTFSPEENEEVIDWLLEKEKGAVEIESIDIQGLDLKEGLGEWNGKQFDARVKQTVRVVPTDTMEGFFVTKIRKIKSTVPSLL